MKHEDYLDEFIRQYYSKVVVNSLFKDATKIKSEQEKIKEPTQTVDQLLDQYNDYMILHKMFGDNEYLLNAKITLNKLKQIS